MSLRTESALTPGERASLRRARRAATVLDDAFRLPGTSIRFGFDPLVGLLPVSGTVVAGVLGLFIVFEAFRCGVPKRTLVRMLANLGFDTAVGVVPVLGTAVDVVWKGNRRNVRLLEAHLGVGRDE